MVQGIVGIYSKLRKPSLLITVPILPKGGKWGHYGMFRQS